MAHIASKYLFVVLLGISVCLALSGTILLATDNIANSNSTIQTSPFGNDLPELNHIDSYGGRFIHCFEIANNFYAFESRNNNQHKWNIGYADFRYGQKHFSCIAKQVTGYGYSDGYIYGRTPNIYFVFQTTKPSGEAVNIPYGEDVENSTTFTDEQAFTDFMADKLGIKALRFLNPQTEFDKLPDIEKSPWDYYWFHGCLNLPDLAIVLIIFTISSICLGILAGITQNRKTIRWSIPAGMLIGLLVYLISIPVIDLPCGFLFAIFTFWPFICWLIAKSVYNIIRAYWYFKHEGLKSMLRKIYLSIFKRIYIRGT